jgi:hypothetical protein
MSYSRHRDADVVLRDGSTVHVRPVEAEDADAVQAVGCGNSDMTCEGSVACGCMWSTSGVPKPLPAEGSDRQGQLVERGGNSKACWFLDRELVVASAKILHQGMPGQHDRGTTVLFEPTHRP